MVILHRFHRSPADAAILHDLKRRVLVAIQEPHPGVDHEDVKTVVRQRAFR